MTNTRIAFLVSMLVAGCGGSSQSSGGGGGTGGSGGGAVAQPKLDGRSCAGTTGSECAGGVCLALLANDQHETGICSALCTTTCATGEQCVSGFPDGNNYCLRSCATSANCEDGFACVTDTSSGLSFCWVTANNSGGAGGGGGGGAGGGGGGGAGGGGGGGGTHVDCVTPGCDTSLSAQSYCSGVAGATQACDCPHGSPSASCTAAQGAANVWCCP